MTFRGDPSWLADALAGTPKKATSVVQLVLDDHTSVVGTQVGSFSRFYLDGVQYLPADGLYTVNPMANFRVLKAFASISNPTGAVARVTYYCHRSPEHTPGGELVELCINTVHIAAGQVVNLESTYDAETDALVLGGTQTFEPLFGLFSDTAGLKIDLNYLCATFPGTDNVPAPSGGSSGGGVTPHPTSTVVQSATAPIAASVAPGPSVTLAFASPVAVGNMVAVAISFAGGGPTANAVDHVSGCGSSAWPMVMAHDATGSGINPTAGIAYFRATAPGSTITVFFNPAKSHNGGHLVAWEINGVTALKDSGTSGNVSLSSHVTPPLDASGNDVYIGVTTADAAQPASSYIDSPTAFTSTYDSNAPDGTSQMHAGLKISEGVETISRTTKFDPYNLSGMDAAALFT